MRHLCVVIVKQHLRVYGGWAIFAACVLLVAPTFAQTYTPGVSYFGRSNYISYAAGDLPFILSAPHGGTLNPTEIPTRTNCASCGGWDFSTVTDTATDDVAAKVRVELGNLTGHLPHIVICHLSRAKLDANREVVEAAQGDPEAIIAWNEFQGFLNSASNSVVTNFGRGFYIDQHGQGHPEQRLELGYLLDKYDLTNSNTRLDSVSAYKNSSSIRTLANDVAPGTAFSTLLRGPVSFGELMVAEGYPATPSATTPYPFDSPSSSTSFFNGGYNTSYHGSDNGGPLSALQIEANYIGVRDSAANRTAYAKALARALEKYFLNFYGINLRTCAPSVWGGAGGNWGTAANWTLGIVPVSSNLLVFAGSGGTVAHNVSALATGNGWLSSLGFDAAAAGAYTLTGNAFSLLDGITNSSAFGATINNALTFVGVPTLAAAPGAISLAGSVTNAGSYIRCLGDVNLAGPVSGSGGLTKVGAGTLALTGPNAYSGPTTNASGTISLNATATFGDGGGLLVFSGGDLLSKNTRSGAPLANPILLAGSSTIFGDGTLTNSLRILPFSANSITTTSGTLTVRHSGTNPFASNNVFRVRFTGGGFIFTRPITLGFIGDLPVTQTQLESYNDDLVGDQTFTGNISGTGQFRRDAADPAAAGRTILAGVNSYSGGTVVNAGVLIVNNPFGSATGSGFVAVSNNGTLGGSGTIAGAVWCAGTISPGQSTGTLTLGGGLDFSGGGTNLWELSGLTTSGEGVNCDQIVLTDGNLALGANAKLRLSFINAASAPHAGDPFWMTSHTWKIISLTGLATNPGSTSFGSIVNGNYPTGNFSNFADANGNVLLSYLATPAPPPLVQSFGLDNTGNFSLSFATQANRTCVLQYTTNLSVPDWINLSTNVATTGALTLTNATSGDAMRFYRILVVP